MKKTKTYWAVFTGEGDVATYSGGTPLVFCTKETATHHSWMLDNSMTSSVRKVHIVEVKK